MARYLSKIKNTNIRYRVRLALYERQLLRGVRSSEGADSDRPFSLCSVHNHQQHPSAANTVKERSGSLP
eukprot:5121667-Pyramimonas_sp.AAC.1